MNEPIILGGGLAGLSACYNSNGSLFEKKSRVGGHARSHKIDGYIFDEGIHVLHTSNKYVLNLMEEIEADMVVKNRDAWIVSHGSMTRYPFQANTYGLPINIVKDCLLGFINNSFSDRSKINNYRDWIYFMFGDGIAKHFMIPYSKKFWGINPELLTTDWVNIRHPKPTLDEVITGAISDQKKGFGINASFKYPRINGFGNIARALGKKCEDRVKCKMEVTNIDTKKKIIEFNGNEKILYNNQLISTIPLPDLLPLINNVPDSIINESKKLKTNSIFVVNIGIDKPNVSEKNWIYYLEKEFSFFRIHFPHNKSNSMVPKNKTSISAEIAYGNDNKLPCSKSEISQRVINDLIKADILKKDDKIELVNNYDIKYGYVIFDNNRKPALKKIHDYLKTQEIIPCGRYGDWAYHWSDESILSGKKSIKKYNSKI